VDEKTKKIITDHIYALAPSVTIFFTDHAQIDPKHILHTGLFDLETMTQSPAWIQELSHGHHHHPETEEYGISSFVYTRQRPFHPERLYEVLTSPLDNVIRAKGFCRLVSRPDGTLERSLAGKQGTLKYGGRWVSAMTEAEKVMLDPETKQYYDSIWHPQYGDKLTQFVII
jgi:G3E family GTPase